MGRLIRFFDWRNTLVVVRPETLIRWHRLGFRIFWRWKVSRGRPPLPPNLRELIQSMACDAVAHGLAPVYCLSSTRTFPRSRPPDAPRSSPP
mgnify:CR=1 FL=1